MLAHPLHVIPDRMNTACLAFTGSTRARALWPAWPSGSSSMCTRSFRAPDWLFMARRRGYAVRATLGTPTTCAGATVDTITAVIAMNGTMLPPVEIATMAGAAAAFSTGSPALLYLGRS